MKSIQLSQEAVDTIRTAVHDKFPADSKVGFSYLSGSFTEGLATPKSDFDAYVVLNTNDLEEEGEIFVATPVGMLEISTLTPVTLDKIASKLRLGNHKKMLCQPTNCIWLIDY